MSERADSPTLLDLARAGIGSEERYLAALKVLGLPETTSDVQLISELLRSLERVRFRRDELKPAAEPVSRSEAPKALDEEAEEEGETPKKRRKHWTDIDSVEDLRTLVALVSGGRLHERRNALLQLGRRLKEAKSYDAETLRFAQEAIQRVRAPELAYERSLARGPLPGVLGREVRLERAQWLALLERLVRELRAFWEGEANAEPFMTLAGHERASLLLRTRDFPDAVVAHLCAVIEGVDGASDRSSRIALLTSLRHAGDPRLVASLATLIEGADVELATEAIQVLGRVDDARVLPTLISAYERSRLDMPRAALAGALARCGDARGVPFLSELLESGEHSHLLWALDALENCDEIEDIGKVVAKLKVDDPVLASAAARALARCGDASALPTLRELRQATSISALWGEIEEAVTAIRARIELRGEDTKLFALSESWVGTTEDLRQPRAPIVQRTRSFTLFVLGNLWLWLGVTERGLATLERAYRAREGWLRPILSAGLYLSRVGEDVRALVAFRRAYQVERRRTEANASAMRAMAHTFLRRAEALERGERPAIAQALLEEILAKDLRLVPSAVRFELERRYARLIRHGEDSAEVPALTERS